MKKRTRAWILLPLLFVAFQSCKKDKSNDNSPVIEKEFQINGFTKVYSTHGFNLFVTRGANFQVKAHGPAKYVNDIQLRVLNGMLDIQYIHDWTNRPFIDLFITMPVLEQINLAGAAKGTVNGFENEDYALRAILSGASRGKINGTPINVSFDINGGSELEISGTTLYLDGVLSGAGKINAYDLNANEVDIEASGGSEARVRTGYALFATATGGSRIYYKGEPTQKFIETSGGGQVIKE